MNEQSRTEIVCPASGENVMEKLVYFIGGIIVGGICTLAALGFDEEDLDSIGGAFPETGDMEDEGYS